MFGLFLIAVVFGIIVAIPVMLLWNWLFVDVALFGTSIPAIGYFQAWGLFILCELLEVGNCAGSHAS